MDVPVTDDTSLTYLERSIAARPGFSILTWGFWVGWMIVAVALLVLSTSKCNWKRYVFPFVAFSVGFTITTGIFAPGWDTDSVSLHNVQYTAFTGREINATLGVNIGLQGFNVTLTGTPETQFGERILYNEAFSWSAPAWLHRVLVESYEEHVENGTPLPILVAAEPMILDAERIRWGRYYRMAGYYAYTFLWLALSLLAVSVAYAQWARSQLNAGRALVLAGFSEAVAVGLWLVIKPYTFIVPFEVNVAIRPAIGWTCILAAVGATLGMAYGFVMCATSPRQLYHAKGRTKTSRYTVVIPSDAPQPPRGPALRGDEARLHTRVAKKLASSPSHRTGRQDDKRASKHSHSDGSSSLQRKTSSKKSLLGGGSASSSRTQL